MAAYYDVPVIWMSGATTAGRAVGNNAAWRCECGEVLLGPHRDIFLIEPCPGCGRWFRVCRGTGLPAVDRVEEVPPPDEDEAEKLRLSRARFESSLRRLRARN